MTTTLNHEVIVAAKKRSAGKVTRRAPEHAKKSDSARKRAKSPRAERAPDARARARPADEIGDLDLEAASAIERFARYARVALTSLREGNRAAYLAHLKRVHASYECIYGHPVALMTIVREAKSIVDAATLHHHAGGGAVDLEGVPSWVTRDVFDRLVGSTVIIGRRGGRSAKPSVVMGVVRLVHARCPRAGAKRLRAEHLTST